MIFTGANLTIKRNFFTQTGNLAFDMNCMVDNTTGTYHFGLSGAQGVQDFMLQSGKLYQGTTLLHAYQANVSFNLGVQCSSGATNVLKDGAALSFGAPKGTGLFDSFYFTRENAGMGATFDLLVSGDDVPAYRIENQGYLLYSGQNAVTGRFGNSSPYAIKVFDSSMLTTQNYSFGKLVGNVTSVASGVFAFSGDYDTLSISDPILTTFNTNFGDVQQLFQITDARTVSRFVFLNGPTDFSFAGGVLNRDVPYLNYSGGVVVGNYPASLVFQLRYGTGLETFSGVWDLLTGADTTSLVSLKGANQYSATLISGSGQFAPNSLVNLQVNYSGVSGNSVQLVISGAEVLNPINQTLNQTP